MTVRLRPRQVLCSKCKGICNENSGRIQETYLIFLSIFLMLYNTENVSKKRKSPDTPSSPPPVNRRANNAPVTRQVNLLIQFNIPYKLISK